MLVLRRIPEDVGVVFPAGDDDREFGDELDPRLGDGGLLANGVPGAGRFIRRADPRLALAVIAVAAGLEHDRQPELLDRRLNLLERGDRAPRGDPSAGAFDE